MLAIMSLRCIPFIMQIYVLRLKLASIPEDLKLSSVHPRHKVFDWITTHDFLLHPNRVHCRLVIRHPL